MNAGGDRACGYCGFTRSRSSGLPCSEALIRVQEPRRSCSLRTGCVVTKSSRVANWRRAKSAFEIARKMRGTFVADAKRHRRGSGAFAQEQRACGLEAHFL